MTSPNLSGYPHQGTDNFWPIETIKSLIEDPSQIPTLSFTLSNVPTDNSLEYDFTLKFLQDVYNPPEQNLNLSQQRLQELHYMRLKDRRQNGFFQKDMPRKLDVPWENPQEPLSMVRVLNRNSRPATNKVFNRNMPGIIDNFNTNKRPLPFPYNYGNYQIRPPEKAQKGKMDINVSYFDLNPKKKIQPNGGIGAKNSSNNVNVIDLDDDDDIIPIQPAKKNKNEKRIIPKHLGRTGQNKNKPLKMIEISDSPESTEAVKKSDITIRIEERAIEEEKDGDRETTTNATNMTHLDELNDNDKEMANGHMKGEEMVDFFNFDVEDLGIKILGEVFLCDRCQKQIPQKDVDKGFKETCASCLKNKNSRFTGHKKNHPSNVKEEAIKPDQSHLAVNNLIPENSSQDNYNILTPLYQGRFYYEESARINILDPLQNKKSVSIGENHQASIIPRLDLYDTNKRKIMKLWKPDRMDLSIYEKFKDEVNDKNSVYLLDEEITEILVRHRYNVEQAALFCVKSNPEFQYYVKRSSNRKRIITRNWEKILENY